MKFLLALSILMSFVGNFIVIQLGFEYMDESIGMGIHPYVAALFVISLTALGYAAASLLSTWEERTA
jgi:hypothetical protein